METTVCIAGGGPAGLVLGLLLARSGVEVTVLEKHGDFLRDFRGDTVHPATMQVLAELGLAERFHELPHRRVPTIGIVARGRRSEMADFRALDVPFPYIAFIPQWDFLNFLAGEAARYPGFRLLMATEAHALVHKDGKVSGLRTRDGHTIRAGLVVAADGRHSALRRAAGLVPRSFGTPSDVVLFKISRRTTDPDEGLCVRVGGGRVLGLTDRGTYWQASYEIPKGGFDADLAVVRADVAALAPFLADRVGEIEELHHLEVRVDRLRQWHRPGLLCIGDAAHAMSPVGGFGVNLAVQDAVAAANLLTDRLLQYQRSGEPVPAAALAAVRRRRLYPTVATQALQRLTQHAAVRPVLRGKPLRNPVARSATLRRLMARVIGIGFRPEHVRNPGRSAV